MSSFRLASSTNTYLAGPTGQIVSYARDPNEFAINDYCMFVPTKKRIGLYFKLHPDTGARVVTDAESDWADGADRPSGDAHGTPFTTVPFQTKRKDHPFRIGDMAIEQAEDTLPLVAIESVNTTQVAVTARTIRVVSMIETVANWAGNTATANALNAGAGTWDTASGDAASPFYNAIKKALTQAAYRVNIATRGKVRPKDLVLLISPGLALAMANSSEVHDYMKYGPFSKAQLESNENNNALWGLPPSIYGFPIVVEDAVRVSDRPNADGSVGTGVAVKADTSAALISRKGGIDGQYGTMNFATVQVYHHGALLQVEIFADPKHRRTDGHVSEDFFEVLAAPETGFLIQQTL